MNMNSDMLKAMVAGYFRYKKQCPVVAFETSDKLRWSTGEPADVLVLTDSRVLYEIEVKISLADLKHDLAKNKHHYFSNAPDVFPVNKFYFAMPDELTNKAIEICNEVYPYAGLLSVSKFPFVSAALNFGVQEEKSARILNNRRLAIKEILYLLKEQSGTVCRLARDKASAESNLQKEQKENIELKKLLTLTGMRV